jgi:hypothetical protein
MIGGKPNVSCNSELSLIRQGGRTMTVTLRNYRGPEDIELQSAF